LPVTLLCASLLLGLNGCAVFRVFNPEVVHRGSIVDKDALAELIPGTSSRADAVSLLGSPTAKATFDDNTWIYIAQVTSTRIGRTPGVASQHVVVLTFDQGGTLRDIRQLDKSDSKPIGMAAGETPSPGSEASFMQQLLGNVGKFTPAGLPGGGGAGGGFGAAPGGSGNSVP